MSQQEATWSDGTPPATAGDDRRADDGRHGVERRRFRRRRAGLRMSVLFALLPPLGGAILGGLLLTDPSRVPWVLVLSFLVSLGSFLLVPPLGRRSLAFSVAGYRRATELAVLVGLTSAAVVVYTLVVYLLLGVRMPWVWTLLGLMGLA